MPVDFNTIDLHIKQYLNWQFLVIKLKAANDA